jgi:hypothetical protein
MRRQSCSSVSDTSRVIYSSTADFLTALRVPRRRRCKLSVRHPTEISNTTTDSSSQ